MVYVALLRGINVGGKTKVEMPRLKAAFEDLGGEDVLTYINSGNVIFRDKRPATDLAPLIEKAINKEFGLDVRVLLRSATNLKKLTQEIPSSWTNDGKQKTDVMFLWEEIDSPGILKKVVINPQLENVRYIDGALVWNIGRENVTKGNGVKLIKTDLYRHMTIRNVNTVRKLYELMMSRQNN
jgi:uncharacterized protein (DUF1697 family)